MDYSKDERIIATINLLTNIMEDSEGKKQLISKRLGEMQLELFTNTATRMILMLNAGGADKELTREVVNAQNELSLELMDDFPHQESIEFFAHNFFAKFTEAIMSKYQKDSELVRKTVVESFGSHIVLEPKMFGRWFRKKKPKKQDLLEDYSFE